MDKKMEDDMETLNPKPLIRVYKDDNELYSKLPKGFI